MQDRIHIYRNKQYRDQVYDWVDAPSNLVGYTVTAPLAIKLGRKFRKVCYRDEEIVIHDGWLYVEIGFFFDGASGPAVDGIGNMLASLIHDALGRAKSKGARGYSYQNTHTEYSHRQFIERDSVVRIRLHWWGLTLFGPWYRVICRLRGKSNAR